MNPQDAHNYKHVKKNTSKCQKTPEYKTDLATLSPGNLLYQSNWNWLKRIPFSTSRKFRYSRSRLRTPSQFRVLAPRIWFQCGSVTCFKSKTRTLFQHVVPLFSLPFSTPFTYRSCIYLPHRPIYAANPILSLSLYHLVSSFRAPLALTWHSPTHIPPYKLLFSRTVSAKRRNVSREGAYVLSSCRWEGACLPTYGTRTMRVKNIAAPSSPRCLPLFYLWPPLANHPCTTCLHLLSSLFSALRPSAETILLDIEMYQARVQWGESS